MRGEGEIKALIAKKHQKGHTKLTPKDNENHVWNKDGRGEGNNLEE